MRISRREAFGLAAAISVSSPAAVAQAAPAQAAAAPPAASQRTPEQELEIARQSRLRDAQRIAMVKLPQPVEPAFQFRP